MHRGYSLIYYINSDTSASKTSLEQEWGKPSDRQKEQYSKPLLVSKVYQKKVKQKQNNLKPYNLKYSDVAHINCPIRDFLKAGEIMENEIASKSIMKELLNVIEKEFELNVYECVLSLIKYSKTKQNYSSYPVEKLDENLKKFYRNRANVLVDEDKIVDICINTKQQSQSNLWFH